MLGKTICNFDCYFVMFYLLTAFYFGKISIFLLIESIFLAGTAILIESDMQA